MDTAPLSRERIGRAIVEVLVRVPTLALPGGLRCVPAVGVASGPILHASLSVAGKKIPVSLGESMNLAMRLSSSCSAMKKRILFPTSLPVIWPPSVEVEEVTPIIVKGMAGQVQLASLKEKEANPPLQTPASRMPAAGV